jgi:hypothetical protein
MREFIELRVLRDRFAEFFRPDEGEFLGELVFKVVLPTSDPRLGPIMRRKAALAERGELFFAGWHFVRRYTADELQDASAFHLSIERAFEPAGEECGTVYDYNAACPHCGVGRRLVGDLTLQTRTIPKSADIASSIARDEWVVSERLAVLLRDNDIRGCSLTPVAESSRRSSRRGPPLPQFFRLAASGPPVRVTEATICAEGPWTDEPGNHCPGGHILGLNLVSTLSVDAATVRTDFAVTDRCVGVRRGLLVPCPLIVISPRLRELLETHKMRGYSLEVAQVA